MLRHSWQRSMISLARSARAKHFMQNGRAGSFLASRFVAGKTAEDGLARAVSLKSADGVASSLFYLGEYVDSPTLVEENVTAIATIAKHLGSSGLEVHVSVDPTQIGLRIAADLMRENARHLAGVVADAAGGRPGLNCLMFDMEDSAVVDETIAIHDALSKAGRPVALTLQAYLRRTADDLQRQIEQGGTVRLVRGAFAEGPALAFTAEADIKASYRRLIEAMLSPEARRRGFRPIIATHDTTLQAFAIETARRNGWQPGEYEFEMLLGVRFDVARTLSRRGEKVRLYVPFGRDWWPHAARRIGESPRNALLLARSLVQ